MVTDKDYLTINRKAWNDKTPYHVNSEFYDMPGFLNGRTSLNTIELDLLGDIAGKKILHLQCHFGQDTLSLAKLGAEVTGVDFSDQAIAQADKIAQTQGVNARFICCDIYSLPNNLTDEFDIVFTSYGTIGWLPDLTKWAAVISGFLKPGGRFVFAEFHPFVWMYNNDFTQIEYNYFKDEAIIEDFTGTYANTEAPLNATTISWNHGLCEVFKSLIQNGLTVKDFDEYNYSPYNVFSNMEECAPGRYTFKKFGNIIPLVYSIVAVK